MIDKKKGQLKIPRKKHFGALKGVLRDTVSADLFDRVESKDQQEDFGKKFKYCSNMCIECVHLHHCSDDKVLHFEKKETVHFNNIKSKNKLAAEVTQSAKSKPPPPARADLYAEACNPPLVCELCCDTFQMFQLFYKQFENSLPTVPVRC